MQSIDGQRRLAPSLAPRGGGEHVYLVDAHVHLHAEFDPVAFLNFAAENLARGAAEHRLAAWTGCLMLADQAGQDTLPRLQAQEGRLRERGWELEETAEQAVRLARRHDGAVLVLVAGRQVVSSERLELLALGSRVWLPDGRPLEEMVHWATGRGAIAVLPWGFGKWWFRRRNVLIGLLERLRQERTGFEVFLGDNGGRPQRSRPASLNRLSREFRLRILPGSDPLPFASHAVRAGSRGSVVAGKWDPHRPLARLMEGLASHGQPAPFGRGSSLLAFARDQVAMQWKKRSRRESLITTEAR